MNVMNVGCTVIECTRLNLRSNVIERLQQSYELLHVHFVVFVDVQLKQEP